MDNFDYKIQIESEGLEYELVFNVEILLLHKDDKIHIDLPSSVNNWKISFEFIEDNTLNELASSWNIEDGIIKYKLNKWYSSAWVENKVAADFWSLNKTKEFKFKFRSQASHSHTHRIFYLTIWKKIMK